MPPIALNRAYNLYAFVMPAGNSSKPLMQGWVSLQPLTTSNLCPGQNASYTWTFAPNTATPDSITFLGSPDANGVYLKDTTIAWIQFSDELLLGTTPDEKYLVKNSGVPGQGGLNTMIIRSYADPGKQYPPLDEADYFEIFPNFKFLSIACQGSAGKNLMGIGVGAGPNRVAFKVYPAGQPPLAPPSPPGTPNNSSPCQVNSDCPAGQTCQDNKTCGASGSSGMKPWLKWLLIAIGVTILWFLLYLGNRERRNY